MEYDDPGELTFNLRQMPGFDKKLLKKIQDDSLFNVQNIKDAKYNDKIAPKTFFNIAPRPAGEPGTVTFLPSPGKKTLKRHLNERKTSPKAQIFDQMMKQARGLKDAIDTTKTAEELRECDMLEK